MALIYFTYGSAEWRPTRNPVYPLETKDDYRLVYGETAGGQMRTAKKGGKTRTVKLPWALMPLAELTALQAFLDSYAKEKFTYYDYSEAAHTVQWVDGSLEYQEIYYQVYAVSLLIREEL